MHEMALTRNVVNIVLEEASSQGASEVKRVHLTIGRMRDIVESMFDGLFAYLARGTIAEHAELIITRTPVVAQCRECGFTYALDLRDFSTFDCPACHVRSIKLISGQEFFVSSIEVVKETNTLRELKANANAC